jgi:predicted dinucleotide-utilizing enzyme
LAISDNVILFFGIGKKTVYKILKQNTKKYQTLTNLASSDVDTCVEAGGEKAVKHHYQKI